MAAGAGLGSGPPLDGFPALVPTPAQKPGNTEDADADAEAAFDKFATLFLPPTPRASPGPEPLAVSAPQSRPPPQPLGTTSPDSEFGSFVSVSAAHDPLSASLAAFDPFAPIEGEQSQSPAQAPIGGSPITPFGEFTEALRARADTNRGLLDELLMHEDEPMYWLNDPQPQAQAQASTSQQPQHPPSSFMYEPEDDLLPSEKPNSWMTKELSDLDLDFFAAPQAQSAKTHRRSSSHSSSLRSPTLSPTSVSSRTLAPPLASRATMEDAPGFEQHASAHAKQTSGSTPTRSPAPQRSGSYAALATSLSKSAGAKWVASFIPTLSPSTSTTTNAALHPPSPLGPSTSPSPSSSLANSMVLPAHHPHPVSAPTGKVPDLSHFTPFGPAHASGSYTAPSGAPGFRNEYDWDKGFSHALERELGHTPEASSSSSGDWDDDEDILILDGRGNATRVGGPSRSSSSGYLENGKPKEGVGALLEKKMTLSIALEGRREMTVGVLTNELVALIHPHLSALLRLPRKWSLLYSLDQHGISLKTLYSRCTPQPSTTRNPQPKGGLLAIQDANGAVFGAWVPDGLKRSVGHAYYGGGESFLWRYLPATGKFDVFKWTGKNEYVAFCEEGFISFGGGDGHYGLYLDDSLLDGSSARCPTFDNEALCSSPTRKRDGTAKFECVGLEVWGVGP
ncbi:Zn(2)-C6 fungal-type domain-containing protein [Mycena kentingensis (nom. inval.)]|nr:Zn(2)-C6 fungal-type domain-containing protein [Mycena kentingensis (nom. inval.)]